MFNIFKKRQLNEQITFKDELIVLENEISLLKTRQTKLEAEILDVATAQDIIRNKVLRKIQNKKEEEQPNVDGFGIPLA